jgi:hypothetical protein
MKLQFYQFVLANDQDAVIRPMSLRDDEIPWLITEVPIHVGHRSAPIRICLPFGDRKLKEKEDLPQRSYCRIGKESCVMLGSIDKRFLAKNSNVFKPYL